MEKILKDRPSHKLQVDDLKTTCGGRLNSWVPVRNARIHGDSRGKGFNLMGSRKTGWGSELEAEKTEKSKSARDSRESWLAWKRGSRKGEQKMEISTQRKNQTASGSAGNVQ